MSLSIEIPIGIGTIIGTVDIFEKKYINRLYWYPYFPLYFQCYFNIFQNYEHFGGLDFIYLNLSYNAFLKLSTTFVKYDISTWYFKYSLNCQGRCSAYSQIYHCDLQYTWNY